MKSVPHRGADEARTHLPELIASALAIGADAFVTHDRDFAGPESLTGLRILDGRPA